MKLPSWFSSTKKAAAAPPTTAELATRVTEAEGAHSAALARVGGARAELATDRTESAAEALRSAKVAVEDIEEMLKILRADLAAAQGRDAEAELARLKAEADALELDLAPNMRDAEEERLIEAEVAAWTSVVDARLAREAHCAEHDVRCEVYRRLCEQLTRTPSPTRNHRDIFPVRQALEEMAGEASGARRRVINSLARA